LSDSPISLLPIISISKTIKLYGETPKFEVLHYEKYLKQTKQHIYKTTLSYNLMVLTTDYFVNRQATYIYLFLLLGVYSDMYLGRGNQCNTSNAHFMKLSIGIEILIHFSIPKQLSIVIL